MSFFDYLFSHVGYLIMVIAMLLLIVVAFFVKPKLMKMNFKRKKKAENTQDCAPEGKSEQKTETENNDK